jgi:hypothetical protein
MAKIFLLLCKNILLSKALKIRDAPDTDFTRFPANLKAGYPVQAGYQISGRIINLTFK